MNSLNDPLRNILIVIYLAIGFLFSTECFSQSTYNFQKKIYSFDSHDQVKKMENEEITILGQAFDTKAGAVILTKEEKTIYIDGLDYWPDDYVGKTVSITGSLEQSNTISKAGNLTNKLIKQGIEGEQYIFKNTKLRLLE